MAVTSIDGGGAGPLTTIFTTPDFCASSAWSNYATPALSSSICMPNGWSEYWNWREGFYSPAICPYDYTRACTIPEDSATGISLGGPLSSGETGHICCPTGYTCFPGDPWTEPWPYSKCQSTGSSTYTASNEITPSFLTTTMPLVYAIQVRWQSSDLSNLETNPTVFGQTYTPTASASAAARTTASAATATASTTDSDDDDDDGIDDFDDLSTGAKVGVVAGATVGLVLVVLGVYLFWRRRSKKHHFNKDSPDGMKPGTPYEPLSEDHLAVPGEGQNGIALGHSPVSPLSPATSAYSPQVSSHTLGASLASEMPASTAYAAELPASHVQPVEMPSSNAIIAELPGDYSFEQRSKGTDVKLEEKRDFT
ncbi:cg16707-like protein [Neofusicoccum parvum]|nr:cg16707-like protein [Neofusicoccum parvum]